MAVFNLGSVRAAGIRSARLVARHHRAHRLSVNRIRRAANRGKLRLRLPRTWQARPLAGTRLSIVSRSGSVDTSITSGPTGSGYVTTATFGFSASENHSKFQCQLDAGAWSACSSPKAYAGLTVGNHVFAVRATDRWGHTDPTPATRSWSVALAVQPPPPIVDPSPPLPLAACANGLDDDGDSLVDLADPGCVNAADGEETDPLAPTPTPSAPTPALLSDPLNYSVLGSEFWGSTNLAAYATKYPTKRWWSEGGNGGMYYENGVGTVDERSKGVFRIWTVRDDLPANQCLSVDNKLNAWNIARSGAASSFDGVKLWLRRKIRTPYAYSSPDNRVNDDGFTGYTLEPIIRPSGSSVGKVYIQRKLAGDTRSLYPSYNSYAAGGTYYLLAQATLAPPAFGTWQQLKGCAYTNPDGSVRLRIWRGSTLVMDFTDRFTSAKGPPILTGGRVGLRSDQTNHNMRNVAVTAATP
jgi:hypothetical protein